MGERFILNQRPSLEAQLANLADEIAYNNHDVDDGLRSGLIDLEQLQNVGIFFRHWSAIKRKYPALAGRRLIHETIRAMINIVVTDLTVQSAQNIKEARIGNLADVYDAPPLIGFSPAIKKEQQELKNFSMSIFTCIFV